LEHIVPFIERCQQENLISTVSCPISTKKGRQQVRGFLAYLETRTAEDADRLEDLVREYNAENKSVFNTWHRNPVSTWKTESSWMRFHSHSVPWRPITCTYSHCSHLCVSNHQFPPIKQNACFPPQLSFCIPCHCLVWGQNWWFCQ